MLDRVGILRQKAQMTLESNSDTIQVTAAHDATTPIIIAAIARQPVLRSVLVGGFGSVMCNANGVHGCRAVNPLAHNAFAFGRTPDEMPCLFADADDQSTFESAIVFGR